ncbi:N-acetylmuramoyl-L-alanine amidase [Paenibacillus sp. KN14-4R]|uniref:N-acetylmuramoyl-L-alanine amidase n=1 Tax=Paenibacillus sp. KN14-4R TaxID=3445773 RepID=UPI003FA071C2
MTNLYSIGIEHEGFITNPGDFTATMYRQSANLAGLLAFSFQIPVDRQHIKGHSEMPGNDHTDPGPNWDWVGYMRLVKSYHN